MENTVEMSDSMKEFNEKMEKIKYLIEIGMISTEEDMEIVKKKMLAEALK